MDLKKAGCEMVYVYTTMNDQKKDQIRNISYRFRPGEGHMKVKTVAVRDGGENALRRR